MKNIDWEKEFAELIPESVDILHEIKSDRIFCSREAVVQFIRKTLNQQHQDLMSEQKDLEQSWMLLKDDYSEICRALGFKGDSWWGDPLVPHAEIVAKAKALTEAQTIIKSK